MSAELGPRAVTEPTGDPGDYLRKRHTSEGPRRRRMRKPRTDPAVRDLTDEELDNRNARIWACVQQSCQTALELEPDLFPCLGGVTVAAAKYRLAQITALQICKEHYGIPAARLAELCERHPGGISVALAEQSDEIAALKRRWAELRGPEQVAASAQRVVIPISVAAYRALVAAGLDFGAAPGDIASDVILRAVAPGYRHYYTKAQDDEIRRLSPDLTDAEIGERLGRSPASIRRRRSRLGIRKR